VTLHPVYLQTSMVNIALAELGTVLKTIRHESFS